MSHASRGVRPLLDALAAAGVAPASRTPGASTCLGCLCACADVAHGAAPKARRAAKARQPSLLDGTAHEAPGAVVALPGACSLL
jgi:hypothetical protein